jgi:hypothetical protein
LSYVLKQKVSKADALNLFAYWLPDLLLPRTKRAAIDTFCENNWQYEEDDAKTALTAYAIYLNNENEDGVLP